MFKLTISKRGEDRTWSHECAEDVISIGRMDENLIELRSKGVSRRHAKITHEGDNYFIVDLKSGNGTFLNSVLVRPNEKNLLQAGDTISIDVFNLKFHEGGQLVTDAEHEEVTNSDILEIKLLKKVITSLDKEMVPSIEVLNGSAEGKKLFLTDELAEFIIGRDPECSFPINEYVISRRHASISKRWGGISIRDLESKNGTFLNNRRIVEEYLHDGDRLALGTIVMIFRNPQEINLAQMGEIKPKYKPVMISPKEIPYAEEAPATQVEETPTIPRETPQQEQDEEPFSALEEWDKLEKSQPGFENYPEPKPRKSKIKSLTPVEIGMIGLGTLVLVFALITIVNLLAS